ncbi:MAG TPA: heparan-alpha-glucosaminide N-acetyltransferase domain-containing protein [Vicinamibacteria bacterium]|nr:heparan-alpha-glucosaminide N-acetyltransferase domain-containing protein [Vicinamibacteria bacterium]
MAIAPVTGAGRLLSLDLLRGLVVLLMLFVNQADSVEGVSQFLRHAPEDADAVTLADLVLPAFLFMVGMSIPFAVGARREREGARAALRHVAERGAALLVMGVLMVNADLAAEDGPLSPAAWGALAVIAAMLVWQARPRDPARVAAWHAARAVGIALMVVLAFLYRGTGTSGLLQIRPHWWGILGIVGWAYLTASLLYLWVGERPVVLLALVAVLNGLYYLEAPARAVGWPEWIGLGSLVGSQGAVALSGAALGVMAVRHLRAGGSAWALAARGLGLGMALLVAGLALHHARPLDPAFQYSKENATPPWGLVSAATTAIAWVAFFAAADGAGWRRWPPLLRIAGTYALLTYLLEPLVLALLAASAVLFGCNPWTWLVGSSTASGLVAAALFACVLARLAGLLARAGVRLQL